MIMNKKGNTMQVWVEIVLFVVLFLSIMTVIGLNMNDKYGKSHDLTMGLNLSSNLADLQQYEIDTRNDTTQGQASATDFGIIKLFTAPKILLSITAIMWDFATGGFINDLVGAMNLGEYSFMLIVVFKLLYFIAVVFIFLKLILKVNI